MGAVGSELLLGLGGRGFNVGSHSQHPNGFKVREQDSLPRVLFKVEQSLPSRFDNPQRAAVGALQA